MISRGAAHRDQAFCRCQCRKSPLLPSPASRPLHHLALDTIGETPTRPCHEAGDLSIRLLLTPLKNGVEDAPKNAGLVRDGIALGKSRAAEAGVKALRFTT
jgi:hypothetical protein